MSLNVEEIRRRQNEAIHDQEVREEEAAIPEIQDGIAELEDLAQEMEDRGEPDGEMYEAATEERVRNVVNEVLDEGDVDFEEVVEEIQADTLSDVVRQMNSDPPEETLEVPHTVQDVRNAVAEEPQLRRIDLSSIPPGMTPTDFIAQYHQTGQLITDSTPTTNVTVTNTSTGTTYVDMETVTTDGTAIPTSVDPLDAELAGTIDRLIETGDVTVDPENGQTVVLGGEPQPAEPAKPLTAKQTRALQRKSDPKGYAEDARFVLAGKLERDQRNIDRKREIFLNKRTLSSEDIAINMKGEIFHSTFVDEMPVGHVEHSLIFDKNFNLLSPTGDSARIRRGRSRIGVVPRKKRSGMRINRKELFSAGQTGNPGVKKYLILDKGVLITSGGGRFKIKVKNNVKVSELLRLKKKVQVGIRSMHEAIEHIIAGVGAVLPPEDFEVLYELSAFNNYNAMTVLLRFRDVTITNAIELSRHLGDIVVKLDVEHYPTDNGIVQLIFRSSVSGQRMTYTAEDAVASYVHSHLTSGIHQSFTGFCTGDQNYTLDMPNVMDIEAHVHRLREFVSWESLEGGPHFRMENISSVGSRHNLRSGSKMKALPPPRYIEKMLAHIDNSEGGFNSLANCFTLVNKGELTFTVDRKRFYLQVMQLFGREFLDYISGIDRGKKYFYKPEIDQFYKVKNADVSSMVSLRKRAIELVMNTIPVYMNGRYIKPTLVDVSDPFEGVQFCPSPEAMYELANVIMYHLTDKLEEYGNTSEA